MRALLIQLRSEAALEVLPADMKAQAKAGLNKKAHSAVILCLGNKVIVATSVPEKKFYYILYAGWIKGFSEHIDVFQQNVLDLAYIEAKICRSGVTGLSLKFIGIVPLFTVDEALPLVAARDCSTMMFFNELEFSFGMEAPMSPRVGLWDYWFCFVRQDCSLKAESSKVAKHEKACLENQHVFIPFAFDTFGFLAPEAEEFFNRVQRVVQRSGDTSSPTIDQGPTPSLSAIGSHVVHSEPQEPALSSRKLSRWHWKMLIRFQSPPGIKLTSPVVLNLTPSVVFASNATLVLVRIMFLTYKSYTSSTDAFMLPTSMTSIHLLLFDGRGGSVAMVVVVVVVVVCGRAGWEVVVAVVVVVVMLSRLIHYITLTLEDVMATLNSKEIKERSKANGDDGEGLYVREELIVEIHASQGERQDQSLEVEDSSAIFANLRIT
ncbi:hypothetical protein Tco_1449733 [Tanacetum coccineum]